MQKDIDSRLTDPCIFEIVYLQTSGYNHNACSHIHTLSLLCNSFPCIQHFQNWMHDTRVWTMPLYDAYPRGHYHIPKSCTIMLRSRNYVVSMPNYGASWCSTACIWVPMLDVVANYSQIVLVFVATTVWQWVPCRVIAWHRPAMCSWQMRKLFVTHACQMARHGANYA